MKACCRSNLEIQFVTLELPQHNFDMAVTQ